MRCCQYREHNKNECVLQTSCSCAYFLQLHSKHNYSRHIINELNTDYCTWNNSLINIGSLNLYHNNMLHIMTILFSSYLFCAKTVQIAYIPSPILGIAQKTIFECQLMRCRLKIECWCQNIVQSCFISDLLYS